MITVFSSPKPVAGVVRQHQENAIASWRALGTDVQIILAAPLAEVADLAEKYQCEVISNVACNPAGVPILSDLFARAQAAARYDVIAYINADIIMTPGLDAIIRRAQSQFQEFLLIGGRTNINCDNPLPPDWPTALAETARKENATPTRWGSDYFVFTKGYYPEIKPFILGRFYWDNWLIYEGRRLDKPVVNITPTYVCYHPHHDYGHAARSEADLWRHPDTRHNHGLFPDARLYYTVEESDHLMTENGLAHDKRPSAAYLWMRLRGWLRRMKLGLKRR